MERPNTADGRSAPAGARQRRDRCLIIVAIIVWLVVWIADDLDARLGRLRQVDGERVPDLARDRQSVARLEQ